MNVEYNRTVYSPALAEVVRCGWFPGTLTGRWYLDRDGTMWVEIVTRPKKTMVRLRGLFFSIKETYYVPEIKWFFREGDVRELFVPIINDCNQEGSK